MQGQFEILSISEEIWSSEIEQHILAQGDYVVEIRILSPDQFRGSVRKVGVVRFSELTVDEVPLEPGDVVGFEGEVEVFTGLTMPDIFANFRNKKVLNHANE